MVTKYIIDREVTLAADGNYDISKTNYKPFTGGALKLGRAFGYMTDWEILTLQIFMRGLPLNSVVVNIGAGAGTSGLAMAEARQDLIPTIYTVDLFQDRGPLGGLLSERNAFAQYNTPLVNQIHGNSVDVGKVWDKGSISLILVDGDHNYQGVLADINAWRPHIKVGGYMLFHDLCHDQWPGVKLAVEQEMDGQEYLMQVDYLGVFRLVR